MSGKSKRDRLLFCARSACFFLFWFRRTEASSSSPAAGYSSVAAVQDVYLFWKEQQLKTDEQFVFLEGTTFVVFHINSPIQSADDPIIRACYRQASNRLPVRAGIWISNISAGRFHKETCHLHFPNLLNGYLVSEPNSRTSSKVMSFRIWMDVNNNRRWLITPPGSPLGFNFVEREQSLSHKVALL